MADMLEYPKVLDILFYSTHEEISEAMWMKERWCQISKMSISRKDFKDHMYVDEILSAGEAKLRNFWVKCLAMYRAAGGHKAPFITVELIEHRRSSDSVLTLCLEFGMPSKMFTNNEKTHIMQSYWENVCEMRRKMYPKLAEDTVAIYGVSGNLV